MPTSSVSLRHRAPVLPYPDLPPITSITWVDGECRLVVQGVVGHDEWWVDNHWIRADGDDDVAETVTRIRGLWPIEWIEISDEEDGGPGYVLASQARPLEMAHLVANAEAMLRVDPIDHARIDAPEARHSVIVEDNPYGPVKISSTPVEAEIDIILTPVDDPDNPAPVIPDHIPYVEVTMPPPTPYPLYGGSGGWTDSRQQQVPPRMDVTSQTQEMVSTFRSVMRTIRSMWRSS